MRASPARHPSTRTVYLALAAAALGLLVAGAAWIVVTGLLARSELQDVRHETHQLRTAIVRGDVSSASRLSDRLVAQSASAHAHTSGPAWWVGANLPLLGTPLRTGRVIATQTHDVSTEALPALTRIAQDLHSGHLSQARLDMGLLAQAAPALTRATTVAQHAQRAISAASESWLPLVSSARRASITSLSTLIGEVSGASRAVGILQPMLGSTRPQRYFIGFLNESEARGLGGIAGAFAIATADRGAITFDRFGTDGDLHGVDAGIDLGAEYDAIYRQDSPTAFFQNSDISPDFRDAARIWAAMWQKKTGEHIDGAISVDPTALSYLLRVTGPASLPDGSTVSADNVVSLTQRKQYSLFPSTDKAATAQRKAYLTSLSRAVAGRLSHGASPRALISALSRAAGERRLLVWSSQPSIEARLEQAGWSGAFDAKPGRAFSSFSVTNTTGGKLDYYLSRQMTYRRTSCAAGSHAVATLRLTDDAPSYGLPPYMTLRLDHPPPGAKPGDESVLVSYYATPGATITRVTLDGKALLLAQGQENGLALVSTSVELRAGVPTTLQVTTVEPAAHGPVLVVRQPLVRPLSVHTQDAC